MQLPKNDDRLLIGFISFFVAFFLASMITLSILKWSGNIDFVVYFACCLFLLSAGLLLYTYYYGKKHVEEVSEDMVSLFASGIEHVESIGMIAATPLVTPFGRLALKGEEWAAQAVQVRNSGVGVALNIAIVLTDGEKCLASRGNSIISAGDKEKIALLPARVAPHFPETADGLSLHARETEQARLLVFYQDVLGVAYVTVYGIREQMWSFLGTVRKTTLVLSEVVVYN